MKKQSTKELSDWDLMKIYCSYCRNNTGFHGHTREKFDRVRAESNGHAYADPKYIVGLKDKV